MGETAEGDVARLYLAIAKHYQSDRLTPHHLDREGSCYSPLNIYGWLLVVSLPATYFGVAVLAPFCSAAATEAFPSCDSNIEGPWNQHARTPVNGFYLLRLRRNARGSAAAGNDRGEDEADGLRCGSVHRCRRQSVGK